MQKRHPIRTFVTWVVSILVLAMALLHFTIGSELATVRQAIGAAEGSSVPRHVAAAFVAAEDPDFFEHSKFFAIQPSAGHASLTTQIVRPHVQGRPLWRTIREVLVTLAIDLLEPREKIVKTYVANVYLGMPRGQNVYGVDAAAKAYFGVSVDALTIAQAAMLAAAARNPSIYSPAVASDRAEERRREVLEQMSRSNAITVQELETAKASLAGR